MNDLIEEFIKDQQANSIGKRRIEKYGQILRITRKKYYLEDYKKLDTESLKDIIRSIEADSSHKVWTKHDYKVVIRKFARWLNSKYSKSIDTSFIKIGVKDEHKLPEELLTPEEIEKLVENCDNLRDKALIAVLYESGCRIGELLSLKIKHVEFNHYGARLIIPDGKTGSRRILIIDSVPLLQDYINSHPLKDSESSLWLTNFNRKTDNGKWSRMNQSAVIRILKITARKAAINKRIYCHLFRHSRATHLASLFTEAQMKEYFGWTQASNMASVYVHLSGRDTDAPLLKLHGVNGHEENPNDVLVNFNPRLSLENFMIDFLRAIAETNPEIKQKFRDMVKGRNMEKVFGVENAKG